MNDKLSQFESYLQGKLGELWIKQTKIERIEKFASYEGKCVWLVSSGKLASWHEWSMCSDIFAELTRIKERKDE